MELSKFWQLLDFSDVSADEINASLKSRLDKLSNEELATFDELYSRQLKRLWDWQYWGAAFVMCGCRTEYDYLDFCNWVMSKGKAVYDAFIVSPDCLAEIEDIPFKDELPYPYIDELDLLPGLLYEEKTGQELVHYNVAIIPLSGKKTKDNKKYLKEHYPKLFERFWFKA